MRILAALMLAAALGTGLGEPPDRTPEVRLHVVGGSKSACTCSHRIEP